MKYRYKLYIVLFGILIFLLTILVTHAEDITPTTVPVPITTTTLLVFKPLVNNNVVTIEQYSFTNCQCMPTTYEFNIANAGGFIETYTFDVEPFSKKHYFLDKPIIILQPKQSAIVKVTVMLPCDEVGQFEAAFISTTQYSRIRTKTYFYLNSIPCFDYNMTLGEYEPIIVNMTVVGEKFNPIKALDLCVDENRTVPLKIHNLDVYTNYYQIDLGDLSWAVLKNKTVSVKGKETKTINITFTQKNEDIGTYNLTISIKPTLGTEEKEKNITVEIEECYRYSIELEKYYDKICSTFKQYNITIENNGKFRETIKLDVIEPGWATLPVNAVALEPGNSTFVKLKLMPPDNTISTTVIINSSIAGKERFSELLELELDIISLQDCYQIDFIDRARRAYYGDATQRFRVKNIGHEWTSYKLLGITGIGEWAKLLTTDELNLSAGEKGSFWVATNPTRDIPRGYYPFKIDVRTRTGQEYSEELAIKISEKNYAWRRFKGFVAWIINDLKKLRTKVFPTMEEELFYHGWEMNTQYEIDLSTLFYDPDLDALIFTVTDTINIKSEIIDTKLLLTPKTDWTGTESIRITVDDGRGGVATTPDIKLVVS